MVHTYHPSLTGYDKRQIFHDRCKECERRGGNVGLALKFMDDDVFARAWKRAFNWQASNGDREAVGSVSNAERPLLESLWFVQLQLAKREFPLDGNMPRR
jgi:hypothetical protein